MGAEGETIKDRLAAAFGVLIEEASIPKPLLKLGEAYFQSFIRSTDEDKLREVLIQARDELIPFILGEAVVITSVSTNTTEPVAVD